MDTLQKIGKFEAISIIIMITINQIIINLPNSIITSAGSSSWINVIYIGIIAIAFCLLICKLFKPFHSKDIMDISGYLGGKFLKASVGIIYILFFILISAILVKYFANSLKLIYFKESPIVFLLLLFLIPVAIAGKFGIKPVSQINLLFTPFLLLSILVILFSTAKNFIPEQIYPIMGFGADKTFIYGISNIFAFSSFAYIYFLIPILNHPEEFNKIAISSIIISTIYLFLSVFCLLMAFPFITFTDELMSMYFLSRMIEFGKFFQRIDAIFIFIWILSALSFLSFTSILITNIFKQLTSIKDNTEMIYSTVSIIFSIALIFENIANIKFMQEVVFKYIVIILVFIITPIILILANLKFKRRNSHEG